MSLRVLFADVPASMYPEFQYWLQQFKRCRSMAFVGVPNTVYSYLRRYNLLDIQHDVTDTGEAFLRYNTRPKGSGSVPTYACGQYVTQDWRYHGSKES